MECECKNGLPKIVDVEEKLNAELKTFFEGLKDGFVQVGPKKWTYPMKYRKLAHLYRDFEVRKDDVWVIGFPRSGTTVTQELSWLLSNDLDFEGAKEHLDIRVPFFEANIMYHETTKSERLAAFPEDETLAFTVNLYDNIVNKLEKSTKRRVIKTHLPFELLPPDILEKGCKVVYICRYPKDVAVSYFSMHSKAWHVNFVGEFSKYWHFFRNNTFPFAPYFEHVKQAFEKKDHKNVLFVFFEEFKNNPLEYIKKFSHFFERPLEDAELRTIDNYLNFDNFKKNPAVGMLGMDRDKENKKFEFVRKGTVGGWKEYFTEAMNEDADEWIERNTEEIGLKYPVVS